MSKHLRDGRMQQSPSVSLRNSLHLDGVQINGPVCDMASQRSRLSNKFQAEDLYIANKPPVLLSPMNQGGSLSVLNKQAESPKVLLGSVFKSFDNAVDLMNYLGNANLSPKQESSS